MPKQCIAGPSHRQNAATPYDLLWPGLGRWRNGQTKTIDQAGKHFEGGGSDYQFDDLRVAEYLFQPSEEIIVKLTA